VLRLSDVAVLGQLLETLQRIDSALPERLVDHMLAWPETYSPDAVVVPLAKRLRKQGTPLVTRALSRLLTAALAHLEARATLALAAPRDWARPSGLPCTCEHCAELSDFLANPLLPVWKLKAAEWTCSHVERTADLADLSILKGRHR
jgi:hypothetical protein